MTKSIPIQPVWEQYADQISRILVAGGYIYCMESSHGLTSTFVPDVDLQRYQAHLRDAYNAGFKDGLSEKEMNQAE